MSYRSWICNNNLVGQDFCKRHFTQLCQGYRQFCLLTYAHSGFVPKTKILEETSRRSDEQTNRQTDKHTDNNFSLSRFLQMTLYPVMPGLQTILSAYLCTFRVCAKDKIIRSRRTDKLTGQRQNLGEKKNLKTIRRKAWKKLQVNMNRQTDKVTHICKCFAS